MNKSHVRQYTLQIKQFRLGLVDKLSHHAAQNKIVDATYDPTPYLIECARVMYQQGLPAGMIIATLRAATKKAQYDYDVYRSFGTMLPDHGASQVKPEFLILKDCIALKGFMDLRRQSLGK